MPSEKFMRHHYGASGYVEQRPDDVCSRCQQTREQHFGLNFADGPHVSGAVLICPTAVFFNNGPASGAPDAVDVRSTESTPSESAGALIRYGVLHRTEGELYSHAPMADGYWTPWHIAADEVASLESRVRFYERHSDKQANELSTVTLERDEAKAALQAEKSCSQEHWNYFLMERSETGRLSVALKTIADMDLQFAKAKDMHDRAVAALARSEVKP